MDAIVEAAMAKWPKVPACTGWLGLDARGAWWMRDAAAQAAGPFASGGAARGARLAHAGLIAFIARNYAADAQGRWFFQNGPQRVFVELEATPLIWRLHAGQWSDHTERPMQPIAAYTDAQGRLYLEGTGAWGRTLGLVHSQDMLGAADWLIAQARSPETLDFEALPARFGYVRSPQQMLLIQ